MSRKGLEILVRRYLEMSAFENQAGCQGYHCLAGLDEAGRGPLAGPVVAAACVLEPSRPIYGVDDSKKLTPAARADLYIQITSQAAAWSVGIVGQETIDQINILQATLQAMRQAVDSLPMHPDLLLVDAVDLAGCMQPVWPVIHGDALSVSIAAASIIAKVTRDRIMDDYDTLYPQYGFARHKGYGTASHYQALLAYGPSPIHRRSFLRSVAGELRTRGFLP
jgi:ribonuclease HII